MGGLLPTRSPFSNKNAAPAPAPFCHGAGATMFARMILRNPLFGLMMAALFALGFVLHAGPGAATGAGGAVATAVAAMDAARGCNHGTAQAVSDLCKAHCQGLVAVLPGPAPDPRAQPLPHRYAVALVPARGLGRTAPDGPPPKV